MKKVFALILCLVLCVFAFASCSKSNKGGDATTAASTTAASTTAASTTAESTTAHVHTPASEYTIDRQATCAAAGSKSYHCTVCDEIIPETVVSIDKLDHTPEPTISVIQKPTCNSTGLQAYLCLECGETIDSTIQTIPIDENAHKVDDWTVTDAANMLNPTGSRTGECTLCHQPVVEELHYEGPIIKVCDPSTERIELPRVNFADARGDKHFYPTDDDPLGNDLYLEFSILWNETVLNFDGANDDNTSNDPYMVARFVNGKPLYYLSPVPDMDYSDAKFSGAFEWMGNFGTPISDAEVTTPATMCGGNPNYSDYPNIAGTDEANPEYGWHRVGIRYHLELLDGKSGADLKDYVGIATGFVDGVAIFKLSTGADGMQNWESMLFKAESDGEGGIVYSDAGEYVIPFLMNKSFTKADTTAYLAFSDVYVSCGKDFLMKVEKVASPVDVDATLEVAEGVEIPAPVYFKLAD